MEVSNNDVKKTLDDIIAEESLKDWVRETVRKTVREIFERYGILKTAEEEKEEMKEVEVEPKEPKSGEEIDRRKIIDETIAEVLLEVICTDPTFKGVRRQVLTLFWKIADKLEEKKIPVTVKDQGYILRKIWDYLSKKGFCPIS